MLPGKLFRYGSKDDELVALRASNPSARDKPASRTKAVIVILVSGLTNGIYNLPYTDPLVEGIGKLNVELVMPVLRSSWHGWGAGSTHKDAEDIAELINELKKQESQ